LSLPHKELRRGMRGRYAKYDILKALKDVGLEKGSTVYVSTSLGLIGFPPHAIDSVDQLCELFYNAIWEVIGEEGTLIVPTYSYTFGKGTVNKPAVFDPETTSADIGSFPNFVLKQDGVHRSRDPMLSVAGKGRRLQEFIGNLPPESYAEGSFLSRLAHSDVKLLNLGIGPIWLPFVHYIDWLFKAPYRYDKIFKGFIKEGEQLVPTTWIYFARILVPNSYPRTEVVGRMAEEAGLWKSAPLGRTNIYSIVCNEYFHFVKKAVEKDRWLLAKGPRFDPLTVEQERAAGV
jgi:aminoglycoside N3'-acetyltransferase